MSARGNWGQYCILRRTWNKAVFMREIVFDTFPQSNSIAAVLDFIIKNLLSYGSQTQKEKKKKEEVEDEKIL